MGVWGLSKDDVKTTNPALWAEGNLVVMVPVGMKPLGYIFKTKRNIIVDEVLVISV